jgi:hypothetical protein
MKILVLILIFVNCVFANTSGGIDNPSIAISGAIAAFLFMKMLMNESVIDFLLKI